MEMFCRQCEQTFKWKACESKGVCGKTPEVATLQDLLVYASQGIAIYGKIGRELGIHKDSIDNFLMEALFATLTNVNFDADAIEKMIYEAYKIKEELKGTVGEAYEKKHGKPLGNLPKAANWEPAKDRAGLLKQGRELGFLNNPELEEDVRSVREILLYGSKGVAAYAHHAFRLGVTNEEVSSFFYTAMASLADDSLTMDQRIELVFECGKVNLKCMEILDSAHTSHFGHPEPTQVALGYKKGPAIIVSGHDLLDLEDLLKQTEGKGIKIYTHGEMLPANAYPKLKQYSHFAGHYGSAWQNQRKEFKNIPASILMTTNCIVEPHETYRDRIFTTGVVGWPGITHIPEQDGKKDFTPVINKALELGGFPEDNIEKEITIGFAHNAVLQVADKIIEAVKEGKIRHFFLIGGCDGARPGRNYYTKFAEQVPQDCLILTLGCGKFRINRLDLGETAGFPRLLDCGQCNDAYSAIVIAQALAKAFNCSVNELPLSLIISWYEQKAVAILLSLLHLGIKNIKLGPTLPAFISENVLKLLVEKFNIQPVRTVEEDLKEALAK